MFHPFVVWSGVKGYIDKIQKKSSWGEMTRQGLNGNHPTVPAVVTNIAVPAMAEVEPAG